MKYINIFWSPMGPLTMISDGKSLTGLHFGDLFSERKGQEEWVLAKDLVIFEETERWLDLYFTGENPDFQIPISLDGSEFRKTVWEILLKIPYGQTMTYGEIAEEIAEKKGIARMSAQAVGGAVGSNPIPILIPCHRVLGANRKLTGYSAGLDRKIRLLELEGIPYIR